MNPILEPLTEEQVAQVSKWKGLSPEVVEKVSKRGLLGTVEGNLLAFPAKSGVRYRVMEDGKEHWKYSEGAGPQVLAVGNVDDGLTIHESEFLAISYFNKTGEAAISAANPRLAVDFIKRKKIKSAVIVPKNDKAGIEWSDGIIKATNGSCSLKVLHVPAAFKDVSDWIKSGVTDGAVFNAYLDAKPVRKDSTADAAAGAGDVHGASAVAEAVQGRLPGFRVYSSVRMQPIYFLEKPFWQKDAFHLLFGRKNTGKSTFLVNLAAKITRGELGPKQEVIWIAAGEDSVEMDVCPRIIVAGGIPEKVKDFGSYIPKLPRDAEELKQRLLQEQNVGLIVLDPLAGCCRGLNPNSDQEVRDTISPLNAIANECHCLIVGVRHQKKDWSNGDAISSVLGSTSWIDVPRAAISITHDDEEADIRHAEVIAGNRMRKGNATAFRIIGVPSPLGQGEDVTKIEFLDGKGKTTEQLAAAGPPSTKKRAVKLLILELTEKAQDLGDNGIESSALSEEVMSATGAQFQTIKNAKAELSTLGLIRYTKRMKEGGEPEWKVHRTSKDRPKELDSDAKAATRAATKSPAKTAAAKEPEATLKQAEF